MIQHKIRHPEPIQIATERLIRSLAALYDYSLTGDRLHDLSELQFLTDYIRLRHTLELVPRAEATD